MGCARDGRDFISPYYFNHLDNTDPNGDPGDDIPPRENDWLWSELWVDKPNEAAKFYVPLFSYVPGLHDLNGKQYLFVKSQGKARAGLVQKPDPAVGNAWVSYVKVSDVGAVVAEVAKNEVASLRTWLVLEGVYYLIQFSAVGIGIGLAFGHTVPS